MKTTTILLGLLLLIANISFSQGRLVLAGNSYVVIDNAAKVVIANSNANAVSNLGTGGIITESEFDQVVWKIGATTGTYVMPFASQAAITQIPFTANISAAGTGAGEIRFSTYPGATWDNNTYRPSDVTHMFDYNTNTVNNSNHVIDRFWIIDALGYGTKPSATFTFTYRDIEHTVASNTIVEAALGAQRFHPGPNVWGDYLPQGTTNTATNTTSGVPVVPADFWRSWTLSETTNPLSVELTYFKSTCEGSNLVFNWQTASENNTDHFEIEELDHNSNFAVVAFIPAQGGNGLQDYTFQSPALRQGVFRLVEVDTDGGRTVKSTLSADCSEDIPAVISFNNENHSLLMQFQGDFESNETLQIFDARGRLVFSTELLIQKGYNTVVIPDIYLSTGAYSVRMKNGSTYMNEQVLSAY